MTAAARMRAVECMADGSVRLADVAVPSLGPTDVLVRVAAAGICGSDVAALRDRAYPQGTVLGHEVVGHVVDAGPAAGPVGPGPVVVVPLAWCGRCRWCATGAAQLCPDSWRGSVGLGVRGGGFAEFVAVDATLCRPFAAGAPVVHGALVEPFAVGLHAVRRSRLVNRPDTPTAVLGAGTIGLMVLTVARMLGAAPVAVDLNPARRRIAARLGATVADSAAAASALLGTAPELVFDCTGAVAAPAQAFEELAAGGQLILVGVLASGREYAVPGRVWVAKELDCRASTGYNERDFADAVDAVAGGAVDLRPVIGGLRPLDDAPAALAELAHPEAPPKFLLTPGPVSPM